MKAVCLILLSVLFCLSGLSGCWTAGSEHSSGSGGSETSLPEEPQEAPLASAEEEEPKPHAQWDASAEKTEPLSDNDLKARIHEAEAQEHLAREMSKLSKEEEYRQEPEEAQTRVLSDIRSLSRETSLAGSSHLMIEADVPEDGLNLAIQSLKRIHQETGAKNQAAKITGEKLNRRGIFTISDKLMGKDLIIEQAGDMNEAILQELNQLMARDETGMNIVLIDTPERLKELYRIYPGLAKCFERISTETAGHPKAAAPAADRQAEHSGAETSERPGRPSVVRPSSAPERRQDSLQAQEARSTEEAPAADPRPVRRVQPLKARCPMVVSPFGKVMFSMYFFCVNVYSGMTVQVHSSRLTETRLGM